MKSSKNGADSAEKNRRERSGDEYPRNADYDREPEPSFRGNDDVGSAVSALPVFASVSVSMDRSALGITINGSLPPRR